jgi:pimeloyl-ACP methyl ester carboxylesterase
MESPNMVSSSRDVRMTDSLAPAAYSVRRRSRIRHQLLRENVRYQIHEWGTQSMVSAARPTLLLAHGWMDVGTSFQFMVDSLAEDRHVIALDWRGFGGSAGPAPTDTYWFADYLGDLDALIDAISPDTPIDLLGHSMGGNVVMNYAGVRPVRIRRLINVEGFGLPGARSEDAPARLVKWLDQLKVPQVLSSYSDAEEVARRLVKNSPRLRPERAAWLAREWAQRRDDGRWHVLGDPAHKRVNPVLYRREEVLACWREIKAPVLWVEGADTDANRFSGDRYPRSEFEARLATITRLDRTVIDNCGHLVHLDQPEALARAIESFLAA